MTDPAAGSAQAFSTSGPTQSFKNKDYYTVSVGRLSGCPWLKVSHEQVHSILHFKDFVNASSKYEIMTIHNLFRKLTHRLFRRKFGYTLRSVNDLYVQKQFPILDDFKTKVKEYYFAEAQAADFSDPVFISKTNNHILKLTKGLIKDALENIDPATQMMILNCIYFKGKE